MKKEQLTLIIRLAELKRIVSGEKIEEYRANSDYYHNIFKELSDTGYVIDQPKTIYLKAGYRTDHKFAIIEVDRIRYEQFFGLTKAIPEDFQKGDIAYTIYIKSVIQHNLN